MKYKKTKLSKIRLPLKFFLFFFIINKNYYIYDNFMIMQRFVYMVKNGNSFKQNEKFYKSNNPKISIIIAIYNAEGFIKNALLSIQNQDFKDIEIILVDDFSKDNSVNLIKEIMKKDPRIILYENKRNKGTLYTKTKGVLLSKGKYIMILDQDDIYTQEKALSTLYRTIEKKKLDILGFAAIISNSFNLTQRIFIHHYIKTPILFQPDIAGRMYIHDKSGNIIRNGDVIWCYIYKSELFKKTINQIDDKFLKTKMNCHEDFLLFFLLTRNAFSLQHIKKIYYCQLFWNNEDPAIKFSIEEKKKNNANIKCQSYINYIEFLLIKTNSTIYDKQIASYELENYYLNNSCRNNSFIIDRGRQICKLFLENKYIDFNIKKKIFTFLNEKTYNKND